MRQIRYKVKAGTGPDKGSWVYDTLENFVLRLSPVSSSLIVRRRIPELEEFNRILLTGKNDKGMGGSIEWKPFTLSVDEFSELCEAILTNPRFPAQTSK